MFIFTITALIDNLQHASLLKTTLIIKLKLRVVILHTDVRIKLDFWSKNDRKNTHLCD